MAANTDKFKKVSRKWVGQIGSGGVADGVTTTIPLASTTNLPTDTSVVVTIDRVDSDGTATASLEESVIGVVSGSNLISCVRGAEGTAQAHLAGAVVEVLITAKTHNDMVDGFLVEHTQLGAHGSSVVTLTGTQTLTNKTLTNPRIDAHDEVAQSYSPSASGTATLDLSLGTEHRITMPAGNITIALSNDTNAKKFLVSITQDSVGSRTVTWFSTIKWAGGTTPTLTTTALKRDVFGFIRTGTNTYDGFVVGQNI